jgi:HD-GYP domain-containing protein (c-di-GMP phosphodiesterase class II)
MSVTEAAGADPLFAHADPLALLNGPATLQQKLEAIHAQAAADFPGLERVAVATYDPATDLLKTFIASTRPPNHLVYYDAKLADSPSLRAILAAGRPRVVNNLALFGRGPHAHTRLVAEGGFRSSYTLPVYQNGSFGGFIFFNSLKTDDFTPARLQALDLYGHLLGSLVGAELMAVRVLTAALKTAHDMVHFRDRETGAHIDRMSRFARLVARELAVSGVHPFSDRVIERIFEFAPLHDLGKIAMPDALLHKEGAFTPEERERMQAHACRGLDMVDQITANFGLEHLEGLDLLRDLVAQHHERLDGSGYPLGLRGSRIRLESRIVAVADVFDALTSARPYKAAWSNEQAYAELRALAAAQLDPDCVEALVRCDAAIRDVQARFRDDGAA